MASYTLTVNGKARTVNADADTPLLYVLRDNLKLNGPKFGCGLAQCGACTVHVDGQATRSCVLPVSTLQGKKITTLEGLGSSAKPHPVQQAFIDEQAVQCGYCTNGMVMATAALLAANKAPSEAQITEALAGNLCRCGTHQRIVRAVQRAAKLIAEERAMQTNRREFLKASGALVVTFSFTGRLPAPRCARRSPWRRTPSTPFCVIGRDGRITVFTGKVDLGTGTRTALAQMAADELDVAFERIEMVMGDTATTPDQWLTGANLTIFQGGAELRRAAASAREALVAKGAERLGVPASELAVEDGVIRVKTNPSRFVSYQELIGKDGFQLKVNPKVALKKHTDYRVVGRSIPRVDIPGKVTGEWPYVHDVRLPGMLHARVVRPDELGARVASVDDARRARSPGSCRRCARATSSRSWPRTSGRRSRRRAR